MDPSRTRVRKMPVLNEANGRNVSPPGDLYIILYKEPGGAAPAPGQATATRILGRGGFTPSRILLGVRGGVVYLATGACNNLPGVNTE